MLNLLTNLAEIVIVSKYMVFLSPFLSQITPPSEWTCLGILDSACLAAAVAFQFSAPFRFSQHLPSLSTDQLSTLAGKAIEL